MLYGFISDDVGKRSTNDPLVRLHGLMGWENAVHHPVSCHNFNGGFFLDPRLPHTAEDFLYVDAASGLLVLLWGTLYNRAELLRELGETDDMLPDPQLIARIYAVKGISFARELNGDFCIVLYQPREGQCLVVRDHLGVKPIAFYQRGQGFLFSTDTVALCRVFHQKKINVECLLGNHKFVDAAQTYHPDVRKVTPGHWVSHRNGELTEEGYWHPERLRTDRTLTAEQVLAEMGALLTDAVRIRASRRFKAGAHVSSGLDSGTVAALARREYPDQRDFYGYSWSPAQLKADDLPFDERKAIGESCAMADMIPAFIEVEIRDVVAAVDNFIDNMGYLPEVKTLELAKSHGTNLIFSGWGGDEFISKDEAGVASDLLFSGEWGLFLEQFPPTRPRKLYRTLLHRILFPAIGRLSRSARRGLAEFNRYLKDEHKASHRQTLARAHFYRSRRELHLGYLLSHHMAERTEVWSVLGYRNGVEYRYPLIDRRIVEYMIRVPSKALIDDSGHSRIILRRLSAGLLPESVRWKKSKDDPAFYAHIDSQARERRGLFLAEMEAFKRNPHLSFIDFERVEQDLAEVRKDEKHEYAALLSDKIWAIKEFHEFVRCYLKKD